MSDSLQPHGLHPTRLLCPWDFPGKSTGVGCHCLLQGIFLTQGSNVILPHCKQTLYHLSHQGSPYQLGDPHLKTLLEASPVNLLRFYGIEFVTWQPNMLGRIGKTVWAFSTCAHCRHEECLGAVSKDKEEDGKQLTVSCKRPGASACLTFTCVVWSMSPHHLRPRFPHFNDKRTGSDAIGLYPAPIFCMYAWLCSTLCHPVDYSPPAPSVHGISQARILEWIAISSSRGSS